MQVLLNKTYNIKLRSGDKANIRPMTGAEGIATAIMQCALNPNDKHWVDAVKFALQLGDEDKSKLEKKLIKANKKLIEANMKLVEAKIAEINAGNSGSNIEVEDLTPLATLLNEDTDQNNEVNTDDENNPD